MAATAAVVFDGGDGGMRWWWRWFALAETFAFVISNARSEHPRTASPEDTRHASTMQKAAR
eukprot:6698344-Lingulodinium_polyedra.AAC.1